MPAILAALAALAPLALSALALSALALAPLAGCRRPVRLEVPLSLRVETVPSGAAITLDVEGHDPRVLGNGPAAIAGLKVVRKEFVSGEVRYWIEDVARNLPRDPWRPPFASEPYAAGHDYPLRLTATARAADGRVGMSTLRLDHAAIRKLWDAPQLSIRIPLARPPADPAGTAPRIEAPPPARNPAAGPSGAARPE